MSVVIDVVLPRDVTKKLWIRQGQNVKIGRTAAADFEIPEDPQLSSVHLCIESRRDGCYVRDLQSTNGTFLNGQRVSESAITQGDELQAGRTKLLAREVHLQPARSADSAIQESAPQESLQKLKGLWHGTCA